jgi:hypothetical protein
MTTWQVFTAAEELVDTAASVPGRAVRSSHDEWHDETTDRYFRGPVDVIEPPSRKHCAIATRYIGNLSAAVLAVAGKTKTQAIWEFACLLAEVTS